MRPDDVFHRAHRYCRATRRETFKLSQTAPRELLDFLVLTRDSRNAARRTVSRRARPRDVPHEQEHRERDARGGCRIGSFDPRDAARANRARRGSPRTELLRHARPGPRPSADAYGKLRGASRGDHNQISASFHRVVRRCTFRAHDSLRSPSHQRASPIPPHTPAFSAFSQTTMAELTTVRKEVNEMRAIGSDLRDARAELVLARQALQDVAARAKGKASSAGGTMRRALRDVGAGAGGWSGGRERAIDR